MVHHGTYYTHLLLRRYNIFFRLAGREVVFQCRDEGLLRAKVRWTRANGMPLPPGSRDLNGRLEIPNIRVSL